jgi:geranylgeranyl pyrophosphate synthase
MDDLTDLRQDDLALGCRSLPIAYALNVCPAGDRSRLVAWLTEAGSGAAAAERARALILASGAELYVAAEMARFRHRAERALRSAGKVGAGVQALEGWLSEAIDRRPTGV